MTQHAAEAGKKEIVEIRTWWDFDYPHIWWVGSSIYVVLVQLLWDGVGSGTFAGMRDRV